MFNSMSPFDIASALESSSPNNRRILWELVDFNVEGEVLNELSIEVENSSYLVWMQPRLLK